MVAILSLSVQKVQIDWTTEADDLDERDFVRFEFKMSFGRLF